jgi:murein DD-endopeptidase MepM/ murein hydrolase activator NlpD
MQQQQGFLRRWVEMIVPRVFAWLATAVYQLTGDWWRGWRPFLTRTTAHLAVLSVAIIALALSNIDWPAQAAPDAALSAVEDNVKNEIEKVAPQPTSVELNERSKEVTLISGPADNDAIVRQVQPHTIIPKRPRLDVVTYTVQAGDTVQSIASQFNLDPTTIMWANPVVEDAPDLLRLGQEITILPIDGVYHQVEDGDTLESIAEDYDVEIKGIVNCEYNHLDGFAGSIKEGDWLIVPGGEKPYEPKVVTAYAGSVPQGARGTGRFQWPVLGSITQGYWYGHRAIDIGAPTGSALLAVDGGFVSFAGWTDVGYGYLVVIDHANGFATYYAHMSNIYVFEGQAVERGQVIGAVGNTGNSTGPHLHFEVRYNGVQQNPRAYLP